MGGQAFPAHRWAIYIYMEKGTGHKVFIERLKDLMNDRGLNITTLSQQIQIIPRVTISNWFHKVQNPNIDYIIAIARFFKVTTDYLFGLEDEFGNKT